MSNLKNKFTIATIFLSILMAVPAFANSNVYGWLELGYLKPWDVEVKTKLDTGAKTSSLFAVDIEPFDKDGDQWVRFTLGGPIGEKEGFEKGIKVEKPVVREVRIKEHFGKSMHRYVVEMDICLGGKTQRAEVTLADRSRFNYALLLGREAMTGNMIVNPDESYVAEKQCSTSNNLSDRISKN